MHLIEMNNNIQELLNQIQDIASKQNLISITAHNRNGLYEADLDQIKLKLQHEISKNKNITTLDITNELNNSNISTIYANTTYYTDIPNVHADNARDYVRFFHEAWNHPDKITMINIIKNKLFMNKPKA